MSATIQHLHELWGRAVLDDDWEAAKRWREARERLEAYEATRDPCAICPWRGSDACNICGIDKDTL